MKKYLIISLIVFAAIACKNQKSEPIVPEGQMDSNLVMLKYKVIGLNDSLIADSVLKMQFKLQAIEKIYFNKKDSIIIVHVNKSQIEPSEICAEIKNRGLQIVEKMN